MSEVLLDVRDLHTHFAISGAVVRAVDGVSWDVRPGRDRGAGRRVRLREIGERALRHAPRVPPAGRIVSGQIIFKGRDLLDLSEEEMRRVRGKDIGMIFQEPMTSLNPVLTVGRQLTETVEIHLGMTPAQSRARAIELLTLVGVSDAERRLAPVPAPVQRGDAPAHDDRHGDVVQSGPDPGRRAHDGARRDHPGADPRADEGALAPARGGHADDHAQPRGGRPVCRSRERDVRGQDRRARHGPRDLRQSAPSLYARVSCTRCRGSTSRGGRSSIPFPASPRT